MATLIQELSLLEPVSQLHHDGVMDTLKSLLFRCKAATTTDELSEIVSDVGVIQTVAVELRTRTLLKVPQELMQRSLNDYEDPVMTEYVDIVYKEPFGSQKFGIMASLLHIVSLLVMPGEIIDDELAIVAANAPPQPLYYDLRHEMKFTMPSKRQLRNAMHHITSSHFTVRWKLIKSEIRFRTDAINPIRKLIINHSDLHPGQKWGLSDLEYRNDLKYLSTIYREGNLRVLRTRWEWGRKLWTLHAKRDSFRGWDANVIVQNGRKMEMLARRLLHNYVIT